MKDREESKDIMTSSRTCSSETDQTEDEDSFMIFDDIDKKSGSE